MDKSDDPLEDDLQIIQRISRSKYYKSRLLATKICTSHWHPSSTIQSQYTLADFAIYLNSAMVVFVRCGEFLQVNWTELVMQGSCNRSWVSISTSNNLCLSLLPRNSVKYLDYSRKRCNVNTATGPFHSRASHRNVFKSVRHSQRFPFGMSAWVCSLV